MGIWTSDTETDIKQDIIAQEVQTRSENNTDTDDNTQRFPTEGNHMNRYDLKYDKVWLGELSELEDEIEKLDVSKLNRSQRRHFSQLVQYLAENSFYTYLKLTFPDSDPLIYGKHIRLLCNILTRAERGEFRDSKGFTKLIITMPPRHLKSRTISETFPSWFMAKDPTRHTIACSYSAELGVKFGAKNKEKFETLGRDFFGAQLSREARAKSPWETSMGARFLGTGIGGAVTGFGADLLIIDDPFKNRQEADSATIREYIWSEWEDTLSTRLQGEKIAIVIHTRWHEDDLIGRLLDTKDKDDWTLVNLPAECENEETDLLGRKIGQPLWAENGYNSRYFDAIRPQARTWSALYQQRPKVAGGSLFKATYFKYFEIKGNIFLLYDGAGKIRRFRKDECWSFQPIDTALKEKITSDYTAMGHLIITPDFDVLVMDIFEEKLEVPKQPSAVINFRTKWQANFQVVEEQQSGIFLEQAFRRTNTPLRTIKAHKDKVARCFEILTYYERGKVYHYHAMPKLERFEAQLTTFPNSKNDDMVDMIAHGGKYLSDIEGNSGIWAMNTKE
ncbi:MAG: phage terminase large subunit [Paraclostridium sp.]